MLKLNKMISILSIPIFITLANTAQAATNTTNPNNQSSTHTITSSSNTNNANILMIDEVGSLQKAKLNNIVKDLESKRTSQGLSSINVIYLLTNSNEIKKDNFDQSARDYATYLASINKIPNNLINKNTLVGHTELFVIDPSLKKLGIYAGNDSDLTQGGGANQITQAGIPAAKNQNWTMSFANMTTQAIDPDISVVPENNNSTTAPTSNTSSTNNNTVNSLNNIKKLFINVLYILGVIILLTIIYRLLKIFHHKQEVDVATQNDINKKNERISRSEKQKLEFYRTYKFDYSYEDVSTKYKIVKNRINKLYSDNPNLIKVLEKQILSYEITIYVNNQQYINNLLHTRRKSDIALLSKLRKDIQYFMENDFDEEDIKALDGSKEINYITSCAQTAIESLSTSSKIKVDKKELKSLNKNLQLEYKRGKDKINKLVWNYTDPKTRILTPQEAVSEIMHIANDHTNKMKNLIQTFASSNDGQKYVRKTNISRPNRTTPSYQYQNDGNALLLANLYLQEQLWNSQTAIANSMTYSNNNYSNPSLSSSSSKSDNNSSSSSSFSSSNSSSYDSGWSGSSSSFDTSSSFSSYDSGSSGGFDGGSSSF